MDFSLSVIHVRCTKGQNHPAYNFSGFSDEWADAVVAAGPVVCGGIVRSTSFGMLVVVVLLRMEGDPKLCGRSASNPGQELQAVPRFV